ncbi:hypothetical protein FDB42_02045 [Clostridium botulinum]|uniref:hypothetical protein n=1 Tax=Clostridium botulinum TaxID=1491 RepID=UPI0013FCF22B|nr:hypothetical protein [Clostridium botulinum]MBY6915387.1 hypothetical protein [Clostridium botulinum]NFO38898.1 hypothetical protein [Clostridium botulinum]NFO46549.1 hypothetical protein [Clostridium botulinum]NFQ37716.1 hypothetical protein [Clostridium botulinum]
MIRKCEYCEQDSEGYVVRLEPYNHIRGAKNIKVWINMNPHKSVLNMSLYGVTTEISINYCPICGRKLGWEH